MKMRNWSKQYHQEFQAATYSDNHEILIQDMKQMKEIGCHDKSLLKKVIKFVSGRFEKVQVTRINEVMSMLLQDLCYYTKKYARFMNKIDEKIYMITIEKNFDCKEYQMKNDEMFKKVSREISKKQNQAKDLFKELKMASKEFLKKKLSVSKM